MNNFSKNLASNLLAYREKRNWSQMDLAQYLGIPRATVANLESGVANPSLEKVLSISEKLNASVESLVSKKSPKVRRSKIKILDGKAQSLGQLKGAELLSLNKNKSSKFKKPWDQFRFLLLEGYLELSSDGESFSLKQGDLLEVDEKTNEFVILGKAESSLLLISEGI